MENGNKNAGKAAKSKTPTEADRLIEEQILKQLEGSSSVTSSTEHTESDEHVSEISTEERPEKTPEEWADILETLLQTDTESEEDEEPEYTKQKSISENSDDIFHVLEDVPSLANMREDKPTDQVATEKSTDYRKRGSGKFVSPLTGLEIEESTESIPSQREEQQESKMSKVEVEESDISDTSDIFYQEEARKSTEIEDDLTAFLQLQEMAVSHLEPETDVAALVREEEAKQFQKYTVKLLNNLINKVVDCSEHLGPEKFLQQNLDARKLLMELVAKLQNFQYEQSLCTFLNRKVVHHFRRKKSFRFITEDSPKTLMRKKQKLQESQKHLDQILLKQHTFLQHSETLQQQLQQEYEQLKQDAESQVDMFESTVKSHLHREKTPKQNANVDRLLLRMRKLRQEISEVRLSLLLKQHTTAKLNEMIINMEDLGNGLNMNNFTTLQAENQALEKTLEERNSELNKLYRRRHQALHTLAHYKENQQILYSTINIQRSILKNFINERRTLKEHLLSLKLQRNRIHKQMKTLSVQSGLLDKPELLYDYDNINKLSEEKTQTVETLRNTLLQNQSKLDQLLAACANARNPKAFA